MPDIPYARLVLPKGSSELTLVGEKRAEGLCGVSFEGPSPVVEEREGSVTIRPAKRKWWDWTHTPMRVSLRDDVPWEIEIRGGCSNLTAHLERIEIRSLEIGGGVSHAELALGRPRGTARVRIGGGVSRLRIRRPAGVGVRVALSGGASELALDEFQFGAVGGPVRWESHDFRDSRDRYEIEIGGGASRLRVER